MDEIRERLGRIEEALYGAGLLTRPVIEPQAPPLVPCSVTNTPFRGSNLTAYDVTVEFQCPSCNKKAVRTVYTKARGVSSTACSCGQVVRVDLQW
jgi:hypothetical protein